MSEDNFIEKLTELKIKCDKETGLIKFNLEKREKDVNYIINDLIEY